MPRKCRCRKLIELGNDAVKVFLECICDDKYCDYCKKNNLYRIDKNPFKGRYTGKQLIRRFPYVKEIEKG